MEWPLGEPDLILNIPEYEIPASGVVEYKFPRVENPLDVGVWVRAATVLPGDREVVHHILAGSIDADTSAQKRDSGVFDNYLIGYAPGNESNVFPADTGVYIAPGGEFTFQLHYTPVGRETVDRSKIGLYFHKEQPKNFYRQDVVINPMINIPANTARHQEISYYEFDRPAEIHDLVPHSHYRGVASKFEIVHADGRKETILSVPNYDFNWQRTYEFVEPKRVELAPAWCTPLGTTILRTTQATQIRTSMCLGGCKAGTKCSTALSVTPTLTKLPKHHCTTKRWQKPRKWLGLWIKTSTANCLGRSYPAI